MNRFNNLIYLILTLKSDEIMSYFKSGFILISSLALYNLFSVIVGTPRLVSYWAIAGALFLLLVFFGFISVNSITIDWELIHDSKQRAREKEETMEEELEEKEPEFEEVVSNDEIVMVEPEDDEFDFSLFLNDTFDKGSAKQLSDAASQGTTKKIDSMQNKNLR